MANDKKCKHPACSCHAAADSDYCSVECAATVGMPDVDCRCPNPGCKGKTH